MLHAWLKYKIKIKYKVKINIQGLSRFLICSKLDFSWWKTYFLWLILINLRWRIDYPIHHVRSEMWTALIYVNYLSYFQQWNLYSSIDSKLGFFSGVGLKLYFQFFANSQKSLWDFWMLFYLDFSIFSNSWRRWKIGFFEHKPSLHLQFSSIH